MHNRAYGQIAHQLALSIQLNDEATLVDFCWAGNALIEAQVERVIAGCDDKLLYFWGNEGSGKSHLLQGLCQVKSQLNQSTIYLPLRLVKEHGPEVLEGINFHDFIALDDIDAIAGDSAWEEALFHLYNQVRDGEKTTLCISARISPLYLPIKLPDLKSRLAWGLILQLHELADEDKVKTLQLHAAKRGFELSATVGQFLLTRCSRNMHELHELLNQLDTASLEFRRKITIPFVKAILGF